ncbi:MAG: TonB-dependent receptor [Cyclobacteriaceae bacterium]
MKRLIQFMFSFFISVQVMSGHLISGYVITEDSEPLIGANIYLKDSYDGATSDIDGYFSFETLETGKQTIIVSFMGFYTIEREIQIDADMQLEFQMLPAFNAMSAVTITAGTFEASDDKKAVVLNSLDVAMTAGATADIAGALSMLPGTQKNTQDGRLFVRGGRAEETGVYIDGLEAANFYNTTGNGVPTRGRFSPFLFKGTYFSTGGYSAEYGQALSSALILESKGVEPSTRYDISLMSVGMDASTVQVKGDRSIYGKIGYTDLTPYNAFISQRLSWQQAPQSIDGVVSYKQNYTDGSKIRSMAMISKNKMQFSKPTILNEQGITEVKLANDYAFAQASYIKPVDDLNFITIGISGSKNRDEFHLDSLSTTIHSFNTHVKMKWDHTFSDQTFLKSGVDFFYRSFDQKVESDTLFNLTYHQQRMAIYSELDHYFSEKVILRVGARFEREVYLKSTTISPRISLAYKLNLTDQISLATGRFYQDPSEQYLRANDELSQERADHYMLNFQRNSDNRVFRVEAYLKDYEQLISFSHETDPRSFANDGYGYAYGLDVFWRDRGGIKNIDYWLTYSWLKSERKYKSFDELAVPVYATTHNVSIVAKRWFSRLKTQAGISYSVASGRPYDHPGIEGLNESRTKAFHDLSYNMAWLPNKNIIVYFSVTNLLGFDQSFGFRFSDEPDNHGNFQFEEQRMPARRMLFLGCFITLGQLNDQLENL